MTQESPQREAMPLIDLRQRTTGEHDWKQAVTNDFLRGESVAVIAQRCACHKLRVEQVLREAIKGLAALTTKQHADSCRKIACRMNNEPEGEPCGDCECTCP